MNLYAYTANDPVNASDTRGTNWGYDDNIVVWGGIGRIAGFSGYPSLPSVYGGAGQGIPAGADQQTILVTAKPKPKYPSGKGTADSALTQSVQRPISDCMKKFLASQGYGAGNLSDVNFHYGDEGNLAAQAAFAKGHPAITIQNNVYVKPGYWGSFTEGTAGFFEETLHTIQWSESGAADFILSWVTGSLMGLVATGNAHNSPLEAQAMGLSKDLAKAYSSSGCSR